MWKTRSRWSRLSKSSFKRIKGPYDGVSPQSGKPSPPTPSIKIRTNGLYVDALVDTGSAITIISEDILKKIRHETIHRCEPKIYRTANNSKLNTNACVKLETQISGRNMTIIAEVAESMCTNMIIGKDWCYRHNVIIDFQKEMVIFDSSDIKEIRVRFSNAKKRRELFSVMETKQKCRTCWEE